MIISDYELTNEQRAELEEYYNLLGEMYLHLAYDQQLIQENAPDSEIEENREYIKKYML